MGLPIYIFNQVEYFSGSTTRWKIIISKKKKNINIIELWLRILIFFID